MKRLICLTLLLLTTTVFADTQGDGAMLYRGTFVQGFSPNGLYSQVVSTSNSAASIHDLTNFLAYGIYCPTDCKVRLMDTNLRTGHPQMTVPGGLWFVQVKNLATPFVNISGAHEWLQQ